VLRAGGGVGRPTALSYSPECPTTKMPIREIFSGNLKSRTKSSLWSEMPSLAREDLDKTGEWPYN
jgi:hypothetical protein